MWKTALLSSLVAIYWQHYQINSNKLYPKRFHCVVQIIIGLQALSYTKYCYSKYFLYEPNILLLAIYMYSIEIEMLSTANAPLNVWVSLTVQI